MHKFEFDPGSARVLIDLLATDDGFRARFSADPVAALESEGLVPTGPQGDSIRANARCLMVGQLASKQEILAARGQLNKMLTAGSSQTVPALDVNPTRGLVLKAAA